jgi:hypothetical protein
MPMTGTKGSKLDTTGTIGTYCVECGKSIEGTPYEASMDGICASVTPVYFCSKDCWEGSEEFNTENWD